MKQSKQIARTIIMTGVTMLALHGLAPQILAVVDRPASAPAPMDERALKMLPLGTEEDYKLAGSIRNERQLAYAMMNILGGGGVAGRGTDEGIALDAGKMEVVEAGEGGWGVIEVPAALIHDDYSTDAYVGNTASDAPGAEFSEGGAEAEEIAQVESEKRDGALEIRLQGTAHGTGEASPATALINGEVYMEGDTLGGYEVVKIGDGRVALRAADGAVFAVGM